MKHFIAYVIVLGLYTELIRSDTEKMALRMIKYIHVYTLIPYNLKSAQNF